MPPTKKFGKDELINASLEIVKSKGLKGLNARVLASTLGCSVQPIFHNYSSMEELTNEVKMRIYELYKQFMESAYDKDKPYLAKGIAYIKFAGSYPEYFKILFMSKTNFSTDEFIDSDKDLNESIIKEGQKVFKLSLEEQTEIHTKAWIFAHGLACLVATNTIHIKEDEIKELLGSAIRELIAGYKIEKGENE